MYTVKVDETKCQGHARCLAFAPDVFDFDDEGYAFVPEESSTFEELPDNVRQAVGSCPERAIMLSEDAAP